MGAKPPIPVTPRNPLADKPGYWFGDNPAARSHEELRAMPEPTIKEQTHWTGIPCPHWAKSLIELTEPEGGEG